MIRIFIIEGREAPDPDPAKTVEEVRQYYATFFPELSNAETKDLGEKKVEGSEEKEHRWEFKKRVGTKGYTLGQYPKIIRVFPDRTGLNFFRWTWACTNLFQRVKIGVFKPCHLGVCEVDRAHYAGGDDWVADMLHHGLCPHCGNPLDQPYEVKHVRIG